MKQLRNITVKNQAKKKAFKLRNGLTKGLIFCSHLDLKFRLLLITCLLHLLQNQHQILADINRGNY